MEERGVEERAAEMEAARVVAMVVEETGVV